MNILPRAEALGTREHCRFSFVPRRPFSEGPRGRGRRAAPGPPAAPNWPELWSRNSGSGARRTGVARWRRFCRRARSGAGHAGELKPGVLRARRWTLRRGPSSEPSWSGQRPVARHAPGRPGDPLLPEFSGFDVQAPGPTWHPRHRDRIAFVRVCFRPLRKERDVRHCPHRAPIRLSPPPEDCSAKTARWSKGGNPGLPGDVNRLNDP